MAPATNLTRVCQLRLRSRAGPDSARSMDGTGRPRSGVRGACGWLARRGWLACADGWLARCGWLACWAGWSGSLGTGGASLAGGRVS